MVNGLRSRRAEQLVYLPKGEYLKLAVLGYRQIVADLIWLRHGHPALHRNEVEFFHVHPTMDDDDGRRVFAYCRSAGRPLGSAGQVVVVANAGPDDYPQYELAWPWPGGWTERGRRAGAGPLQPAGGGRVSLSLAAHSPFSPLQGG